MEKTATGSKQNIYAELIRLGWPILIGQLGMIVVSFADNIMVGRYTTEAYAASSFVNNVFNVAILASIGFTYGITPLAGALFGHGHKEDIGAVVRRGLNINILFTVLMTAVMGVLYFFLDCLGQPEELLPLIRPYYLIVLAGMIPVAVFNVFAQWSYAVNDSRTPMWIILSANAMNVFLNWLLIYGNWGMPELGLTGAGIATLAARLLCPAVMLMIFFNSRHNREYRTGWRRRNLHPVSVRKFWRTSLPTSLQMAFETGAFSISAVMAGWIGKVELASFQSIVILGTLGFCIYYSLGAAIAAKVANATSAGAETRRQMRRVAFAGYMIMIMLMSCSSFVFIFFGHDLMSVFSEDPAVIAVSSSLILPLVLYQLGDATQITFANALRGTSNVMPILWIAFFSYMVLGLPSTYILAFTCGLGLWGIVLSFSVSLFTAGGFFLYFFLRTTRPVSNLSKRA